MKCTDFIHKRTSPPWIQHRDLSLWHDLSHYLTQTCLRRTSASVTAFQPMNSRSFVVPVTPCPLCHHHQTTIELLLHRDSRLGYCAQSHEFLFRRAQLEHSFADSFGIPKTSQALSSRRHPRWSARRRGPDCGCGRDSSTSSHRRL